LSLWLFTGRPLTDIGYRTSDPAFGDTQSRRNTQCRPFGNRLSAVGQRPSSE